MKRFYSHFTYIYPDTYLQNTIVELDATNNITDVFTFEKELEKTTFYSGILFFVPNTLQITPYVIEYTKKQFIERFGIEDESLLDIKAIMCNIEY